MNQIAYSPDGARLVTTGQDGTLCLLDADSGECLRVLQAHQAAAMGVAYSHGGNWIASSSEDGTIVLWNAKSDKPLKTLRGHEGTVWPVAFSPDDRLIASGGADGTIRLWNRDTGALVHKFGSNSNGGGSTVSRLLFSNSGKRLISSDWLGFLRVWNVEDGRELKTWRHGHRWVSGLALSPDGKTVASAGYGNVIQLWESGPPPMPGISRRAVKAAGRLVDETFRQVTFLSDVVATIQTDETLTEAERDLTIRIATARGDNPFYLNKASWEDVRLADREKSIYRQALSKAERACRIVPSCAEYQVTLGLASYRAGSYEAALAAFRRARDLRQPQQTDEELYELTGIAMSHYRLGDLDTAAAMLSQAQELAETELWRRDEAAQALLREARQLIESRSDEHPSSSPELG